MMKIIPVVVPVLFALVAAVSGQKAPCCGPKQFMAGNGATVGQVDPTEGAQGFYTYQYGAFDFSKREFGYYMVITYPNGTSTTIRIIQKYAQGSQWVILDDVKYCSKQPAQKPEPNVCIPANATYVMTSVIGGFDHGLWMDTWAYTFQRPRDPVDGNFSVNVVSGNCFPVGASFIGARYDGSTAVPFVSAGGMLNMTLGIPDPDKWFTVPSFCNQEDNHTSSRQPRSLPFLDHFNFAKFF